MLNERSQTKRVHIIQFHFHKILGNVNYSVVTGRSPVVIWAWGRDNSQKHEQTSGNERHVYCDVLGM